jgi:ankyrin repeat protein
MKGVLTMDDIYNLIDRKEYDTIAKNLRLNKVSGSSMLGVTPLIYATMKKDLTAMKLFLKYVDVNETDQTNKTSLHYAIKNNHLSAVDLLIKNGAKVDNMDSEGMTERQLAHLIADIEIIKLIDSVKD